MTIHLFFFPANAKAGFNPLCRQPNRQMAEAPIADL